ncbi:ABC transporter substrate-binding protein [Sporosarcina sp. FSL W7-1349]|uniref:ABC transporter substrate-binding protein n=1 Tax=Sporosarcina sp. FSL W7-1349 TaxID=2921561 RepID=UPI0030FBDE2E
MGKKFLITALLILTVLIGACGNKGKQASTNPNSSPEQSGGTGETERITIKYAPLSGVSGIAVQFGAAKGFFEEEGLDVEFISVQDPITGLLSGDIDIADAPTTNAILSAGKGAPIKMVSSLFRSKGAFYLIGQGDIESIEELKGKTIGAAKFGSGLDVYTRTILQEHGLDPDKDVTLVANGTHQEAYASFTNGQVDATIIHEPWVSYAESEKTGKLLARGWDYLPTFHTGVLVASDDAIAEKPEAIKRLLRAYFTSQKYAKENTEEFKEFYLANSKVDAGVLSLALERELEIWENDPNVSIDSLNDTQKIQQDLGFQDELYDVEKFVDLRFIPEN